MPIEITINDTNKLVITKCPLTGEVCVNWMQYGYGDAGDEWKCLGVLEGSLIKSDYSLHYEAM